MRTSIGARTMIFPTPVLIVGSYDASGRANLATVAWGGVCCSEPPCIAISLRKATYSYGNIVEQKAFTVSPTIERYLAEADYFGIASGRKIDKFAATGLTPVEGEFVHAPYAAEFPFVLECKLIHTIEIGLHTQFIGEILDTKIDDGMLTEKGLPDINRLKPVAYMPQVRDYYGLGNSLGRSFSIGKTFLDGAK